MFWALATAILAVIVAVAHSVISERVILVPLFREQSRGVLGAPAMRSITRAVFHMPSVAWAALGIGGNAFPNAHFVVAFALGATGSVLLAVGLFALSFHSARSGHDDRVRDERNGYGTDSDGA